MAILKTAGSRAALMVSHGGQKQVVTSEGHFAAVHDGEMWRQVTRNGASVRKPGWSDDHALEHGARRSSQDEQRAVRDAKSAEAARVSQLFADRRSRGF